MQGTEKRVDGDIRAIAKLFDRRSSCRMISPAHNVIEPRLRDAAENTQTADRDIARLAQRQNTPPHRFPHCHHDSPAFFHKEYRLPSEKINSFK